MLEEVKPVVPANEPEPPSDFELYVQNRQSQLTASTDPEEDESPAEPASEPAAPVPATPETVIPSAASEPEPAPGSDPDVKQQDKNKDKDKDKDSKESVQRRFDEMTLARRQAERDLETERTKRVELEQRIAALEKPQPAAETDPDETPLPEPQWEDFEEAENQIAAFTKAAIAHSKAEEARVARLADKAKPSSPFTAIPASESPAPAADEEAWKAERMVQVETVKARHPDFDTVTSNPDIEISAVMTAECVDGGELGLEIAYYLGTHPEEAKRIRDATQLDPALFQKPKLSLSEARQVRAVNRIVGREFGKIEEQLKLAPASASVPASTPVPVPAANPKPAVSRAPAPIKPIAARTSDTPQGSSGSGDFATYEERRTRELLKHTRSN